MTDDIKSKTRSFITRSFRNLDVQDDDDIFAMGFANSLFAMQLVMFIEKEFQMTVQDDDLHLDNFRSVSAVAELVRRKTA